MSLIFSETIQCLSDLPIIIEKMRPYVEPHSLILFEGDLGAGKTTLTSELLKSYGCKSVTSPTYALHHSYRAVFDHNKISIEHLDLYRLKSEDDVETSGLWDLFQNIQSIIIIEWADRISIDRWPLNWNRYQLKITKTDAVRVYDFCSF